VIHKREIALGLVAVASTVVALMLQYQLKEARALTAQLRAQVSAAVTSPDRSAPAIESVRDATPRPAPVATTEAATPPAAARNVNGREDDGQAHQRQLLKDPRYVAALREQRRLTYRLRRDNAMRLFGFSQETADAIIDLDIDGEMQVMALDPTASGDEMRRQYDLLQRDHDAKMLALLGQDRFDHWQSYMETRGTRMQVDRFRTQLNGADALRDDQVEPLITALDTEQKQMQKDVEEYRDSLNWEGDNTESVSRFRTRQLEIIQAAHKRMLASAASILSTSQSQRLAEMLKADLEQRASQERMEVLRQKLGKAADTDVRSD
jgi:hypothetical protein